MKVLVIGSERNLFIKDSEAQKRIKEYGKLFEELHIIIFSATSDKVLPAGRRGQAISIAENILIYPTNTRFKPLYLWDVYNIAKRIVGSGEWGVKNSVITAQDPIWAGLAGWLLKLMYGIPLQLQIHADILSPYFWKESFKNKIGVILAKFLLLRADGIRVVSQRIKDSLNSKFQIPNSKIAILPIFVDVKKIQSAKPKIDLHQKYPDYDFIILMASRLTKEKNIGIAIEAMAELERKAKSEEGKVLLLIVGDGPEFKKLKVMSEKRKVNVKFESWTDDLVSYYKTADLFLLTSNYEGYGRTVIEAMAAGLPVIMTDVGLAGELLIDDLDGRVAPVGDIGALVKALWELKENADKREEFKSNSLRLVEKWPTKQEYLEKYKSCLLSIV